MPLSLRLALLVSAAALAACSPPRSSSESHAVTFDGGLDGPDGSTEPDADGPVACTEPTLAFFQAPPPAPPAYATCIMNLDANVDNCEAACVTMHPDDPNPDPATCPDGYQGSSFHARMLCITQCNITYANAWFNCCTTAGVDGKPIDLGGTSDEAATCHLRACWGNVHNDYSSCLSIYGGYTGHEHHGDPCKMDVFSYCNAIFNGGYDTCTDSWRTPTCGSTGCDVTMPCALDNWIHDLGDDEFATREAAHMRITSELQRLIRENPTQMQCVINIIRGRFLNHPDVTDPEVANRLRNIWNDLVHSGGGAIPPGCP